MASMLSAGTSQQSVVQQSAIAVHSVQLPASSLVSTVSSCAGQWPATNVVHGSQCSGCSSVPLVEDAGSAHTSVISAGDAEAKDRGLRVCQLGGYSPSPRPREQWKRDALAQINRYRRAHGAKALVWDNDCEQMAQKQANFNATSRSSNGLTHTKDRRGADGVSQGQNNSLYGSDPTKGVKQWYSEVKNYPCHDGSHMTGHFTQLVWKDTEKVGIARGATRKSGQYAGWQPMVANFKPSGNVTGAYAKNIQAKPRYEPTEISQAPNF